MIKLLLIVTSILLANTAYAQVNPYNQQPQNIYSQAAIANQQQVYPTPQSANVSRYNESNGVSTNYDTTTGVLTNSNGALCYNTPYGLDCRPR